MELHEVGWGSMEWIALVQNREKWRVIMNAVMNLQVPYNVENFLTTFEPVNMSYSERRGRAVTTATDLAAFGFKSRTAIWLP